MGYEKQQDAAERILRLEELAGDERNGLPGSLWKSPEGDFAVYTAKSAGFCFGVRRAIDTVYREIENGQGPIYTYGPIIHNDTVVNDLAARGVRVLRSEEELDDLHDGTVIIRSHGVAERIYRKLEERGLQLVDATCPYVRKIHRAVQEKGRDGYEVVIIGNARHPEVEGIRGWCSGPASVIETEEEARAWKSAGQLPVCIVSQTTFHHKKFYKLVEIIRALRYDNPVVLNTICNATEERQTEARSIALLADAMIVIGGKHSSNTQKLYEICKKECSNTFFVQTFDDLNLRLVPSRGIVGISAGASTPNILIEEVSKLCQKTILNRC
jgi:4-hydroxy-3-methylbut-2-enyl diphosphate reductase